MKKLFLAYLICGLSISFAGDVDKVVVVVNDEAITQYDVNEFTQATLVSIPNDKRDYVANDLKKQQISMMVDQYLIMGVAKKRDMAATDEMVDSVMDKIKSSMQMDNQAFAKHLQAFNVSPQAFRKHLQRSITASLVQESYVKESVRITPKMLAHHIESDLQAKTKYIFNDYKITKGELNNAQQKDHAERLYNGIKAKNRIPDAVKPFVVRTPFDSVAKEAIPDVFYKKLVANKPGSVIGPFKLDNGYHVVWYREQKAPVAMTENEAGREILSSKANEILGAWMKNLRASAYIQYFS